MDDHNDVNTDSDFEFMEIMTQVRITGDDNADCGDDDQPPLRPDPPPPGDQPTLPDQ
jgi:hypothetical protein